MNNGDEKLDECGCCGGVEPLTPVLVTNVPGLTALAYRVGTHGSFKETMLSGLSGRAPLRALTTRDDDDPAIAFLDGWGTVLDVLSFYQERIANEGYLRTATERRSILEMARSIGYELRPGVAAGTYLAFALETAPGAPASAKIPIGTKAQSTPAQDELPQTFETIDDLVAWGAWNELKPEMTEPSPPAPGRSTLYLKGTSTNLKPGDAILVAAVPISPPGNPIWDFRRAASVTPIALDDENTSYTIVTLDTPLEKQFPSGDNGAKVYALRQRAALFGYNAPDWRGMPDSIKREYVPVPGLSAEYFDNLDLTDSKLTRIDAEVDFNWDDTPDPAIQAGTYSVRWTGFVKPPAPNDYTFYTLSDDGVRLWVDGQLKIDNWTNHGATEDSATITLEADKLYPIRLEYYQAGGAAVIRLSWLSGTLPKAIIPANKLSANEWPDFNIAYSPTVPATLEFIFLDAVYPQILPDSWVILSTPGPQQAYQVDAVAEESRTNFTLTAKTSRLTLKGGDLAAKFGPRLRDTVVFAQSEEITLAERPITENLSGNSIVLSTTVEGLPADRFVAISGLDGVTGQPFSEIAVVARTEPAGAHTELVFASNLEGAYERDSVVIKANVGRATHGETREEVLGSGDGSQPFQKFALKEKPLTHVSAPTASGAKSTLEVRGNDVLWDPASDFYRLAPAKRAYTTRIADDGTVAVQFGDGATGARLPTGGENISAKYRVGIGLTGMVAAGQINLLMSRPLGVEGVTNPLAPTGAEDPERLDQARQNAPLTVLTLDRIVSQQDFEDFSRAFGGIRKAQATWLWDGESRLVHLTIAGADGGGVPPSSDLYKNLAAAIDAARHADQRVRMDAYQSLRFNVEARLLIDRRYLFKNVKAAVEAALIEAFSFKSRFFGQAVTASEVIAIGQGVNGVTAVDLERLYFTPPETLRGLQRRQFIEATAPARTPAAQLPANVAHWEFNIIKPAELLTINPAGIKLTEIAK